MLNYSRSLTSAKQLSQITRTVKGLSSNDIDDGLDAADLVPDAEYLNQMAMKLTNLTWKTLMQTTLTRTTLTWMTLNGCCLVRPRDSWPVKSPITHVVDV